MKIDVQEINKIDGFGKKAVEKITNYLNSQKNYISKYNPEIRLENNKIHHGDCLELMNGIPDDSISLVLCDLPFEKTKNTWDSAIDLNKLWQQYKRILKPNGVIALHAEKPYDVELINSNPEWFKYEWIWKKESGVGHLNANFAPMKNHENILIFSKAAACFVKDKNNAMTYNPQMRDGKPYIATKGSLSENYDSKNDKIVTTVNNGERYPLTILSFNRDKNNIHPTQKPLKLIEYFIKTYTNKGETVLDNTSGSGTVAVGAEKNKREFICIEKSKEHFENSNSRLHKCRKTGVYI